jgi:hypothetical protein
MQNSTINGEAVITSAQPISVTAGSSIQQLFQIGTLTLADSTVGAGSSVQITGPGMSSFTNSTLQGLLGVDQGGSLVIDNSIVSAGMEVVVGGSGTGTMSVQNGSVLNFQSVGLSVGDSLGSQGTINLTGGGGLGVSNEAIGNNGNGNFNQSGGTHTVFETIALGLGNTGVGTYVLSGGTLDLIVGDDLIVGSSGTGTFTQTGGLISADRALVLVGQQPGSNGTFTQSGGSNSFFSAVVGGNVFFSNVVNGYVDSAGGAGIYNLSGSAVLNAVNNEWIGAGGTGTFNQNGGTNFGGTLQLGGNLSGGTGTYNLTAGNLNASMEQIGGGQLFGGGVGVFNQSGGVNTLGILSINAGALALANANDIYNLSGGVLDVAGVDNNGTFNYSGGTLTMQAGATFTNEHGASFNLSGGVSATIDASFTNNGTVTATGVDVLFNNAFFDNGVYSSDPSTNEFQTLNIGPSGYLEGTAGDIFDLLGNFVNLSTENTLWDTSASELVFTGGGVHTFDLAGQSGAGFGDNFAWGALQIDPGNTLDLAAGSGNALYVGSLSGLVIAGDTITNLDGSPGLFIYYNPADNPSLSGDYSLTGGGELAPASASELPEPRYAAAILAIIAVLWVYRTRMRTVPTKSSADSAPAASKGQSTQSTPRTPGADESFASRPVRATAG